MANKNLNNAKEAKNDEFYTQLEDIEKEMKHYKAHFKGKTVLCNCDDPYESNFFKYFAMNFNYLELKKLIATCYATSPIMYTQLTIFGEEEEYGVEFEGGKPYKIEITEVEDANGDGAIDLSDVEYLIKNKKNTLTLLKGDGDFRSPECVELLKESDIVVTNPPFSLFREYIVQLIKYKKDFIIIGNMNALHYKDVFPLIKANKVWLGASIHSGDREFRIPDHYVTNSPSLRVDENGNRYVRVPGVRWYTTLDYPQRHEDIILYKKYTPEEYPSYYNFDGIDVKKVSEIPCDYFGYMGVPDNFIDQYNPDQFEIIGLGTDVPKTMVHTVVGDQIQYIKDGECVWSTPYTIKERKAGNSLRISENGLPGKMPYSRMIIRRKKNGNK